MKVCPVRLWVPFHRQVIASKALARSIERGTTMERNTVSIILLVALALYAISPVDAVPGPIDDIILFLIYGIANQRKLKARATAVAE